MKQAFMLSAILACLAISYYHLIYLPRSSHNLESAIDMQIKCSKLAKDYFDRQGFLTPPDSPTYECHYNKKLNIFFILITNEVCLHNPEAHQISRHLIDILSNKIYGQSSYTSNSKGRLPTLSDIIPIGICSEDVWNNKVKQYMED